MTYVLNRLLSVILTPFLITLVTFAVTNILPGDVAMMIMGTQSNPEALAGLRETLGLNDPLVVQYGRWVAGLVTGDWGDSLIFKKPIAELLAQKAAASAVIVTMSMTIALALAVPLGVWAAVHRDKWQDTVSSSTALMGVSLPDFFWGIVMILVFARWLGWFPSSGIVEPSEDIVGALRHAFLPSLALGLGLMAHLTRMTRSTMTGILGQEFIRVVAGADDFGGAGAECAKHHHRHRGGVQALPCADHTGRGAEGGADALCRGGAGFGDHGRDDHAAACAAQHHARRDRAGDDFAGIRHSGRGGAFVSGLARSRQRRVGG